jgi:hypothetical protein
VGHGRSSHSMACPTYAIMRRVLYLRQNGATPNTALCAFKTTGNRWAHVSSKMITTMLQASAAALPDLGFAPSDVTARSLRAGGAMALLCGKVDQQVIRLVGRWQSDSMFRYLHAQALPLVAGLAQTMLHHGNFTLLPGTDTPAVAQALLHQHTNPNPNAP